MTGSLNEIVSWVTEFHLLRPIWLLGLAPALALLWLLWRSRDRQGSWHTIIDAQLLQHLVTHSGAIRRYNLLPAVAIGWLLACIALAGPSWQRIPQPVHQKQDALVIVLDLSYSMKSADLSPSRIDRVRQKLLDLLRQRKEGTTGLVAFAGDAHIVTPLTDDIPTITNLLPALDPAMMPVPGSDIPGAIQMASDLLHSAGINEGKVLLVADALPQDDIEDIVQSLHGSEIELAILGVGTAQGAPIPLPQGGFAKDHNGNIVMPSLESENLQALAQATDGRYRTLALQDDDLDYLLAPSALPETQDSIALGRTADTWQDQGYWFALPLLPLALALFRRGWLTAMWPLLLLGGATLNAPDAHAQRWKDLWQTPDQQGQAALEAGDHAAASTLFDDHRWAGTAAYRNGDFETASKHFANDDSADGWYNRGNALAKAGQLDEALAAYEKSLTLDPDREDARANQALVEALKKQQEQNTQPDQNPGQDDEQNQEQDSNGSQSSSNNNGSNNDASQDQQSHNQPSQHQPSYDEPQDDSDPQAQGDQENTHQDDPSDNGEQEAEQNAEQTPAAPTDSPSEQSASQTAQQAMTEAHDAQTQEEQQAMEQWLRRVPDDPSGLLREKFRYESLRRQQENARERTQRSDGNDAQYW